MRMQHSGHPDRMPHTYEATRANSPGTGIKEPYNNCYRDKPFLTTGRKACTLMEACDNFRKQKPLFWHAKCTRGQLQITNNGCYSPDLSSHSHSQRPCARLRVQCRQSGDIPSILAAAQAEQIKVDDAGANCSNRSFFGVGVHLKVTRCFA